MFEATRTSDSGIAVLERSGTGEVLSVEHDEYGALTTQIRCSEYRDGILYANLYTAEVEDHYIAMNVQDALYSGRPVNFKIEWWDFEETGDMSMGATLLTRATVDTTKPAVRRRLVAQ